MCTVIIRIPHDDAAVQLLAVRDEDPGRGWDPLGAWWPDHPGVVGVRDRRAGGAWLAAEPASGRLAVVLNREGAPDIPTTRSSRAAPCRSMPSRRGRSRTSSACAASTS